MLDGWVAALRSGAYAQTHGRLEITPEAVANFPPGVDSTAGYCCLGVLIKENGFECGNYDLPNPADLATLGVQFGRVDAITGNPFFGTGKSERKFMQPVVFYDNQWLELVHLNDHRKLKFDEIADLITKHMEYTDAES